MELLFYFNIISVIQNLYQGMYAYGGADKSLARPTSQCILFDG